MTYEEALAKVRSHGEEYGSLLEAADVLERERKRWDRLRSTLQSTAESLSSKNNAASQVFSAVIVIMDMDRKHIP